MTHLFANLPAIIYKFDFPRIFLKKALKRFKFIKIGIDVKILCNNDIISLSKVKHGLFYVRTHFQHFVGPKTKDKINVKRKGKASFDAALQFLSLRHERIKHTPIWLLSRRERVYVLSKRMRENARLCADASKSYAKRNE